MTMQKHRAGEDSRRGNPGVQEGREGRPEPAWAEEYRRGVARCEAEAARQRKIFESRADEILAAHPGKHIAVCAGEVFAADTALEVTLTAMRAHGGRASFFYSPGDPLPSSPGRARSAAERERAAGATGTAPEPAWAEEYRRGVARCEAEAARQRKIFESRADEILAAHPGKHIAVCAGEVFAADTALEVTCMAMRAHGGRASFFYSPGDPLPSYPGRARSAAKGERAAGATGTAPESEWAEYDRDVARGEAEAVRQREIFESRRDEILAAHPGKHIAICAGEVFAADTALEVTCMAMCAHGGRASFFYSPGCAIVDLY